MSINFPKFACAFNDDQRREYHVKHIVLCTYVSIIGLSDLQPALASGTTKEPWSDHSFHYFVFMCLYIHVLCFADRDFSLVKLSKVAKLCHPIYWKLKKIKIHEDINDIAFRHPNSIKQPLTSEANMWLDSELCVLPSAIPSIICMHSKIFLFLFSFKNKQCIVLSMFVRLC